MSEAEKKIDVQIQFESERSGKSKLKQYQDMVVGNRSLWFLIKFELIILLFSRIPGALGILLRKIFYPFILGETGTGVVFGSDTWFRHPLKIRIGAGSIIDDGALIDAKGSGNDGISIGKNCYIGRGSVLSCKDGSIHLGDYVNISTWCNISSNSKITIGEKTLLGPYTAIFATAHHFDDPDKPILEQGWGGKEVIIGPNCWLGARVTVLDGVTIGPNCVIGAAAVVMEDLPADVIAVGAPAKQVKKRK